MITRPLGFKIRHRSLRSCVAAVEAGWRKLRPEPGYGVAGKCPVCQRAHTVKTYHLNLVDDGTCIVSPKVFDNLCRAGAIDGVPTGRIPSPNGKPWRPLIHPPFEYVDTVEPPPLGIGMGRVADAEGRVLYRPGMQVVNLHEDYD